MLVLHYLNWAGTPEEFNRFSSQLKSQVKGIEGAEISGIYIPTSEWHYVVVWNVTTYEKVLEGYKKYSDKHGPLKMSLGKIEILHTLEELPFL